jgi:beta-RFAP synthase
MGFLDLNGQAGRRFGSLGLGLNAPDTLIELAIGQQVFGSVAEENYVLKSKQAILAHANIDEDVSILVHHAIPRHFGLGSGTQMALAVGEGINQLFNLDLTLDEIASVTSRGMRSGIGIGTFASGGLVLDGGRGVDTVVPPIISQQHFPEDWTVVLIFDHQHVGMHGDEEVEAFASLKDAGKQQTEEVNHQIMTRALPAVKEKDLTTFGEAVSLLQAYTGDYFAPVQGGRYVSQLVAEVLNDLIEQGVSCVGQSSWGPTGFAIFENNEVAEKHLTRLKATFQSPQLSWLTCKACNVAASVNVGNKPLIRT